MARSSTKNVDISPGQCRAARALLHMRQGELAAVAGLGLSTVVDFERERRRVSQDAIGAIRSALEAAGVQFIAENGGGEGVRLEKPKAHLKTLTGSPLRRRTRRTSA